MGKTNIARMVWPEVAEFVQRKAVVMIPLANIEPSGRHSVMGGEQFMAEYFCEGVAARTESLWLPTIPVGYAPNWMGFPGSTSFSAATMTAILEELCLSMLHHGFDHIMLVNNHAGNEPIVDQAARQVRAKTGVAVANIPLPQVMRSVAGDLYPNLPAVGGHGGEPGVSARLFLCPDDMRLDLAVKSVTEPYQGLRITDTTKVRHQNANWMLYLNYEETIPSGGAGYPFNADPHKGEIVMNRMVDWGVDVVNTFKGIETGAPVV